MSYGFDLDVGGDVLVQMKKIEAEIVTLNSKVEESTKVVKESFDDMGHTIKETGKILAEVFAVREMIEFGKELLHITAEFEGFDNVIKYSSRNGYDATQNLDYLTSAIGRLHLPMRQATEGFSEMQAGLIGTGIEGQRLRNLFEGISTASSVLHLSSYNLSRTLYDLKEIGEIGLNQRIMRSLQTALPGIGEIVKETFHKSFHELNQEKFSGGAFLEGLSSGLQKHFAPGLANAGNSLIAQMNDMETAITKVKLELGENLRPLFIEIMQDIRAAFDSGPVRFLIQNIRPLAETLMSLIKMWVEYKAAVWGAKLAMEAWALIGPAVAELAVIFESTEVALWRTEIAAEAATVAVEGFNMATVASGVGAFAIAIGWLVEQFRDLNVQVEESVNKLSNLKGVNSGFEHITGDYKRIQLAFSNKNLSKTEKSEVYSDMVALRERIQTEMDKVTKPSEDMAQANLDAYWKKHPNHAPVYQNQAQPLVDAIKEIKTTSAAEKDMLLNINSFLTQLRLGGVKPDKQAPIGGLSGDAFTTSRLAGASGGLGEAKVINIHFHAPLQENIVPDGRVLKQHGEAAVQLMLRAINNVALNRSSTQ